MKDLLDVDLLTQTLEQELVFQEQLANALKGQTGRRIRRKNYDRDAILRNLLAAREILLPFIGDTQQALWKLQDEGAKIIGEGAQGALLDLDLGGYPNVTSSHPGKGGFEIGTGINTVDSVIGVTKAYATRVGAGPMPTELTDATGS